MAFRADALQLCESQRNSEVFTLDILVHLFADVLKGSKYCCSCSELKPLPKPWGKAGVSQCSGLAPDSSLTPNWYRLGFLGFLSPATSLAMPSIWNHLFLQIFSFTVLA